MNTSITNILIISYFYPPCSLTAAQRPAGWVKYLHTFGYRPIVITRNWDVKIQKPKDQLVNAGSKIKVDTHAHYEVHYLPYKATIRDRLYNSSFSFIRKCSKFFTFRDQIGENFSNHFIPFANLFDYAVTIIPQKEIEAIIITANPFIQFRFGYLLYKRFNIPWIADYRDDWTTTELVTHPNILERFVFRLHTYYEQKWVASAAMITSVSPYYVSKISQFVGIPGYTIYNGFDDLITTLTNSISTKKFVITYNGTLYPSQDIEGFIKVINSLITEYYTKIDVLVQFPGVAFDPIQSERIHSLITGFEKNYFISDRIPKHEVLHLQADSDLLLMLSHLGLKGAPSSKLYEYLSLRKPILCYPSDDDVIASVLTETKLGLITRDKHQLRNVLAQCIVAKINGSPLISGVDEKAISMYRVQAQVEKLSRCLTKVINEG
jgi:glycosyltransferase involved in cell wall biosynthesis